MDDKDYTKLDDDDDSVKVAKDEENKNDDGKAHKESSAKILRDTLAKWYVVFRNIAAIVLLSVLVFIGIKIVLSSAGEKAKYKQMLMDWLVGLCLLFVIHFFMVFTLEIVKTITNSLSAKSNPIEIDFSQLENAPKVEVSDEDKEAIEEFAVIDGNEIKKWKVNYMGYIRFFVEYYRTNNGKDAKSEETITNSDNNDSSSSDTNKTYKAVGYLIIYLVLVCLTCKFVFIYLKRVITMAMLTILAPLMAMTYPIDKLADGKAQGFDEWFKEYFMNALIQPFHLLVYTVVITSVIDLVKESPVYAIVALGSIIPLENMMRRFFNFDRRGGGRIDNLSKAAGLTAIVSTGIDFAKRVKDSTKVSNVAGKSNKLLSDNNKIKFANSNPYSNQVQVKDFFGTNNNSINDNNKESVSALKNSNNQNNNKIQSGAEENQSNKLNSENLENSTKTLDLGNMNNSANSLNSEQTLDSRDSLKLKSETPQRTTDNNISSKNKNKKIRLTNNSIIRSITSPQAKRVYKAVGRKSLRAVNSAGKFASRLAISGAVAGGFGLATGIADGKVKVADIAANGFTIDKLVGKDLVNKTNNALGSIGSSISEAKKVHYDRTHTLEQQKAKLRAQRKEAFLEDKENNKFIKDKYKDLSKQEIREKLDLAGDLSATGLNDINNIGNTMDLIDYNMKQGLSADDAKERALKVNALAEAYTEKDVTVNSDNTKDKIKQSFEKQVSKNALQDNNYKKQIEDIETEYKNKLGTAKSAKEKASLLKEKQEAKSVVKQEYIDKAKAANKKEIESKADELMTSLKIMKGIKNKE